MGTVKYISSMCNYTYLYSHLHLRKSSKYASIFLYGEKSNGKPRQYILEELESNLRPDIDSLIRNNRYIELNIFSALLAHLKPKLHGIIFDGSWMDKMPISPEGPFKYEDIPADDQAVIKKIQSHVRSMDHSAPQDAKGGFFQRRDKKGKLSADQIQAVINDKNCALVIDFGKPKYKEPVFIKM